MLVHWLKDQRYPSDRNNDRPCTLSRCSNWSRLGSKGEPLSLPVCVCVGGGGVNNMPIVLVVSFACTNTVHTFLQVQLVLLVILLIAIADFLIGTFIPRNFDSQDRDRGFMGYSGNYMYMYMYIITCVCVYIIVTVCVITLLKLWH